MCTAPNIPVPPPPPAPPPVLEQLAPKSAGGDSEQARKKAGLSRYKIGSSLMPASPATSNTNKLGGIPKKTGV
jgi:hypothetical protein